MRQNWTVRPARPEEAAAVCTVLRSSIEELCRADHDNDPAILAPWLANKTPEVVLRWIGENPAGTLVAVGAGSLAGVGSVLPGGRVALNYAAPWAVRRGVGTALLAAMEDVAACAGCPRCTLTSTQTARAFYLSRGYTEAGPFVRSFGGKPAFPMERTLQRRSAQRRSAP